MSPSAFMLGSMKTDFLVFAETEVKNVPKSSYEQFRKRHKEGKEKLAAFRKSAEALKSQCTTLETEEKQILQTAMQQNLNDCRWLVRTIAGVKLGIINVDEQSYLVQHSLEVFKNIVRSSKSMAQRQISQDWRGRCSCSTWNFIRLKLRSVGWSSSRRGGGGPKAAKHQGTNFEAKAPDERA
jgi:hypothetical protein